MQHASLTILALVGSLLWGYAAMATYDNAVGKISVTTWEIRR